MVCLNTGFWLAGRYAVKLFNAQVVPKQFNSIQFKFICIVLFTIQIVAKQLYGKLTFYNIFIYCRNLIYLTYGKIW